MRKVKDKDCMKSGIKMERYGRDVPIKVVKDKDYMKSGTIMESYGGEVPIKMGLEEWWHDNG
jgi:hypothetical protein